MELEEVRRQLESLGLRLCDSDSPDDRQHYGELLAREILLSIQSHHQGSSQPYPGSPFTTTWAALRWPLIVAALCSDTHA